MSLFKTRDWWSITVGEEEEFDHGCLCVANVDNDVNGYGKQIKFCFCFVFHCLLLLLIFFVMFAYVLL